MDQVIVDQRGLFQYFTPLSIGRNKNPILSQQCPEIKKNIFSKQGYDLKADAGQLIIFLQLAFPVSTAGELSQPENLKI